MTDASQKTVLIVDDMKLVRLRLTKLCKNMAFKNIFDAASGAEAWKIISEKKIVPDIILTDYNMPDMDGMDFLKLIREHEATQDIPALFITAESDKAIILEAVTLGIADFIVKPFSDEVLEEKIRLALNLN